MFTTAEVGKHKGRGESRGQKQDWQHPETIEPQGMSDVNHGQPPIPQFHVCFLGSVMFSIREGAHAPILTHNQAAVNKSCHQLFHSLSFSLKQKNTCSHMSAHMSCMNAACVTLLFYGTCALWTPYKACEQI